MVSQTLSWNDHIALIKDKISKNIRILARLRYSVPKCVLLFLYHAQDEPYFTYCNIVWALLQTTCLQSLSVKRKHCELLASISGKLMPIRYLLSIDY
jgi:hypothetical protein